MIGMTLQQCQEARAALRDELEQARAENKRMVADLEEQARLTEQAQAENERQRAATATAHAELDKVEQYFVRRAKERSISKEDALLQSLFSEPYMALVKAQALLAEGSS
jgi:hypothetical protein